MPHNDDNTSEPGNDENEQNPGDGNHSEYSNDENEQNLGNGNNDIEEEDNSSEDEGTVFSEDSQDEDEKPASESYALLHLLRNCAKLLELNGRIPETLNTAGAIPEKMLADLRSRDEESWAFALTLEHGLNWLRSHGQNATDPLNLTYWFQALKHIITWNGGIPSLTQLVPFYGRDIPLFDVFWHVTRVLSQNATIGQKPKEYLGGEDSIRKCLLPGGKLPLARGSCVREQRTLMANAENGYFMEMLQDLASLWTPSANIICMLVNNDYTANLCYDPTQKLWFFYAPNKHKLWQGYSLEIVIPKIFDFMGGTFFISVSSLGGTQPLSFSRYSLAMTNHFDLLASQPNDIELLIGDRPGTFLQAFQEAKVNQRICDATIAFLNQASSYDNKNGWVHIFTSETVPALAQSLLDLTAAQPQIARALGDVLSHTTVTEPNHQVNTIFEIILSGNRWTLKFFFHAIRKNIDLRASVAKALLDKDQDGNIMLTHLTWGIDFTKQWCLLAQDFPEIRDSLGITLPMRNADGKSVLQCMIQNGDRAFYASTNRTNSPLDMLLQMAKAAGPISAFTNNLFDAFGTLQSAANSGASAADALHADYGHGTGLKLMLTATPEKFELFFQCLDNGRDTNSSHMQHLIAALEGLHNNGKPLLCVAIEATPRNFRFNVLDNLCRLARYNMPTQRALVQLLFTKYNEQPLYLALGEEMRAQIWHNLLRHDEAFADGKNLVEFADALSALPVIKRSHTLAFTTTAAHKRPLPQDNSENHAPDPKQRRTSSHATIAGRIATSRDLEPITLNSRSCRHYDAQ